MQLPEIKLPNIDLPFDIPVLLHPPVDHFAIALPVVILLLEFYNLFAKRKSIGVFSFILVILTVLVFAAAYLTGSTDGKETFDLLSPEGQEELKGHKLLGTYLLFGSVVLLFFKLLASTGKGFLKALFFIVLIGFIAVTFKQGKDGGELVYEYGANVERVKTMDDEMFDLKEELEEAQEAQKEDASQATSAAPSTTEETPKTQESPAPVIQEPTTVAPSNNSTVETLIDSAKTQIQDAAQNVMDTVKENTADTVQEVSNKVETELQ